MAVRSVRLEMCPAAAERPCLAVKAWGAASPDLALTRWKAALGRSKSEATARFAAKCILFSLKNLVHGTANVD